MGARGNIQIDQQAMGQEKPDSLFLYTHWAGGQICEILAAGLTKGRPRSNDDAYMTRHIFNELQGNDRDLTGFGIQVGYAPDNEYEIPRVFWIEFDKDNFDQERIRIEYNGVVRTADEWIAFFLPASLRA
jgi:hypothetical protein